MTKVCDIKELKGKKYRCYFELALLVIGGKWKPIILFHLAQGGVMRYSELRRAMPGVTERMLARQLRELERDGLVSREVFREVPPRVEYRLTDMGCAMIPALLGLREWGVVYERHLGGEGAFVGEGFEDPEPVSVNPLCQVRTQLLQGAPKSPAGEAVVPATLETDRNAEPLVHSESSAPDPALAPKSEKSIPCLLDFV